MKRKSQKKTVPGETTPLGKKRKIPQKAIDLAEESEPSDDLPSEYGLQQSAERSGIKKNDSGKEPKKPRH